MKLYYTPGACSLVSRIIINELGLNCEFEAVDLKTKKTESGKDFYQINPKGAVPVLELDNGEILTENAIIQQYLVEKEKAIRLLPPVGDFKRYRYLEWQNFAASDLHKGIGVMFSPDLSQEVKDKVFIPLAKKKLGFVEKHLANNKFLMGDQFTLPDAYLFVMLSWAVKLKIPTDEFVNLKRYFKELNNHKSIQQSVREEGLEKATT